LGWPPDDAGYQKWLQSLDAARIAQRDDTGRAAAFPALRHTFISDVDAGGVHP
jgi:hypothetical protein